MTTPGSEELDESHPALGLLLEVVLVEFHHGSSGLFGRLGHFSVVCGGVRLVLVGLDKVGQISQVPGAFVGLNLTTIPVIVLYYSQGYQGYEVPEVSECWVASDLVLLADALCLGTVQLGNFHLGVRLELLSKLVPYRGQLLAVATPEEEEVSQSDI